MHNDIVMDTARQTWVAVCELDDIIPNTGVCALVNGRQIAVFHVDHGERRLYAIENYDPNAQAGVLSRGLVGSIGDRIVVASPIYKHHFDLRTGDCLESSELSVATFPVRVENGTVWLRA